MSDSDIRSIYDWEAERKMLWDTVNDECDDQIQDAIKTFSK